MDISFSLAISLSTIRHYYLSLRLVRLSHKGTTYLSSAKYLMVRTIWLV